MNEKPVFDTEKVIPTYFKLALPIVLSMVITLIYNLADTYFIARTNDTNLVAGVSICTPLFTTLMAIGNIFGQGGNSLIARLLGSGDRDRIRRVSSFCFYIAIALGVVIGGALLLCYRPMLGVLGASEQTFGPAKAYYMTIVAGAPVVILSFIHSNLIRSEGMATESMIGTVAGSLLNIVLDPVFILFLGWGAFGAALATVLGYALTDLISLFFVLKKSSIFSVDIRSFRIHPAEFGQIFSVGISAALTNIASSVCIVFMNQFLLPYGDEKIAALGIVMKVTMIVVLALVGFSFGGVPLFGFLYGSGNREKLRELLRFCTAFLCMLAAAESALVFVLAKPLMKLFIDTQSVIEDGALIMRWQVSGMVFAAVVLLYTCVFQASGKALPALIMSLSRQGLLFLVVFLAATHLFGYTGFLAAQPVSDALSAVTALLLYRAAFSRDQSA